jgi:myo-inositol 2-dehydrogenase/D-chiro-inositol 1-dehydrogenase
MKVLILGDGADERAWALWFDSSPEHQLEAIYPPNLGSTFPGVRTAGEMDEALATAGVELVLVGGPLEARGEALRRAAAEGLAIICLHPPGADSEPYYQVALSRQETGAIVIPYLPLRLHPGVVRLRQAIRTAELGSVRGVRYRSSVDPAGADLPRHAFACAVDVIRALVGEIEAVTASGDPSGEHPDLELIVQLRAAGGLRGEIRLESGSAGPALITVNGTSGVLALEYDPAFDGPARLTRHTSGADSEEVIELADWDPHEAIMQTLVETLKQHGQASVSAPGPNLQDGTRAMELSEAVVRSLRRGRTIELHYEAITEEASFKSIMTSTGCTILLGILLLLPVALAGPALGMSWTIYLAWLIPPVLVAFAIAQILRLGIRREERGTPSDGSGGPKQSDRQ